MPVISPTSNETRSACGRRGAPRVPQVQPGVWTVVHGEHDPILATHIAIFASHGVIHIQKRTPAAVQAVLDGGNPPQGVIMDLDFAHDPQGSPRMTGFNTIIRCIEQGIPWAIMTAYDLPTAKSSPIAKDLAVHGHTIEFHYVCKDWSIPRTEAKLVSLGVIP